MSWDTTVIAGATVLAAVLAVFLTRWLRGGKNDTRWRLLSHKDIPMWIIYRVYRGGFPNKYDPIRRDRFFLKGTYYEYSIRITDPAIREPIAKVRHLKVFRRRKR